MTKDELEAENARLLEEKNRLVSAMNFYGTWYQCKKCSAYNFIGYICHSCKNDPSVEDDEVEP